MPAALLSSPCGLMSGARRCPAAEQQFFNASPLTRATLSDTQTAEDLMSYVQSFSTAAREHFTPRDIVHLTTSLVVTGQDGKLAPNHIVTIYDPTAGTGGFLSEGDRYIQSMSNDVTVSLHGQELNPESYAICKADMLIKGQSVDRIKLGNTLSEDQLRGETFDFMLSNPPFGVEWKKVQKQVTDEHKQRGYDGRFGPGRTARAVLLSGAG